MAEGGGGDGGHIDVFAIRYIFQPVEDLQADFGFEIPVHFKFFRQNPNFFRDLVDALHIGLLRLSDLDVGRDRLKQFQGNGFKFDLGVLVLRHVLLPFFLVFIFS